MKKYFSLLALVLVFTLSSNSLLAQNRIEIDKAANSKTKELRKTVKFDQGKMRDVFKAFQAYEMTFQRINNNLEENKERLEKINTILDKDLKQVLNDQEYERYLKYYREEL